MSESTTNLGLSLDTLGDTRFKKAFKANMRALDTAIAAQQAAAGTLVLSGSKTFDAPSLVDAAGSSTTVTVTGALMGDFVIGCSLSVDLAGITVTGYVSAPDTVTVRLQNESGGTLDLASATLRVLVRPH